MSTMLQSSPRPRVSVIIPTYNRAELLDAAIQSVLAQNYPDLEILIADDGSTDNTAEVVARFGEQVKYLALPHRGQPAAPRNAALAAATGDYIAFLDSDDLFLPEKLALQVAVLDANPDIGVVYSDGTFFDGNPQNVVGHALAGLATPSGDVFGELLRANFIFIPLILVRRSVLEETGGFNEHPDVIIAEDYHLWLRLALHTRFHYLPAKVAAIRVHPGSISANRVRTRNAILAVLTQLDSQYPAQMATYAQPRHEAYAITHSALALATLRQGQWGLSFRHLFRALRHTSQLPALGLHMVRALQERRRQRASIQ